MIASGRSFFTNATSEFVVPRSIPIARGGAFGSKISSKPLTPRPPRGRGHRGGRGVSGLLEIFDPKAPPRAIGIDLGTTNSLVAFVKNDRPEAIIDCDGISLLPSVVHYGPTGEVVVGVPAQRLAAEHPRETIVSVKRFMGRGADDAETKRLGPYAFESPREGEPNVV